jgi:hypothetical protein
MTPAIILLFNKFNNSPINLQEALSVDAECLQPNCSPTKMLLISICRKSLSYVTRAVYASLFYIMFTVEQVFSLIKPELDPTLPRFDEYLNDSSSPLSVISF